MPTTTRIPGATITGARPVTTPTRAGTRTGSLITTPTPVRPELRGPITTPTPAGTDRLRRSTTLTRTGTTITTTTATDRGDVDTITPKEIRMFKSTRILPFVFLAAGALLGYAAAFGNFS